jgi:hypothetical protein
MSRPKKKEINFSKESVVSILQEIYNELVEQRNTAIRIQNKMLAMMRDPEDMQLIGPIIKEQQKIINDCVEKKLSLAKIQSSIWEKNKESVDNFMITDLDDNVIESLINKDINSASEKYKVSKK